MDLKGLPARVVSPDGLFPAVIGLSGFLFVTLALSATRAVAPALTDGPGPWLVVLSFLATTQLLGSLYAHLVVSRLGLVRGSTTHLVVAAIAIASLVVAPRAVEAVGLADRAGSGNGLVVLALSAGPAAFFLSSTTPLLSAWYGMFRQNPWWLSSVTAGAGLVGVLGYTLVLGPTVALTARQPLIVAGTAVVVVVLSMIVIAIRRGQERPPDAIDPDEPKPRRPPFPAGPPRRRLAAWLGATLATAGLAAATTELITTDGVSAPLFAAGPLAVYLLSLAIAFSKRGERLVRPARILAPIAAIILLVPWAFRASWPAPATALTVLVAFLVLAMAIHGRLVADRPLRIQSTRFYLAMATGAWLGTTIVVLVAPIAFPTTYEYPIFVVAGLFALAGLRYRQPASDRADETPSRRRAGRRLIPYLGATLVGVLTIVLVVAPPTGASLAQERTFRGAVRVDEAETVHREYVGTALRGTQFADTRSREPTGPYARSGPLGQVFDQLRSTVQHPTVAIVGLGVGAPAAYARDVDRFTFFEADPSVAELATDPRIFTYLSSAPINPKVVLGDPRRSLAAATPGSYDMVVVDPATSSSAAGAPVRLLSREALSTYAQTLRSGGFVLYNLADPARDLAPDLLSTARSLGFSALQLEYQPTADAETSLAAQPSTWVVVGSDPVARRFASLGWHDGPLGTVLTDDSATPLGLPGP